MNKAVFVNLDNTLIKTKSGRSYAIHSEDWQVNIDVVKTLIKLNNKRNYQIIIISNQPQILQGLVKEKIFIYKLEMICSKIEQNFKLTEPIKWIFTKKENSFNFMPNPGMFYEMALEHELSLPSCITIGTLPEHKHASNISGVRKYYDISEIHNII